MSSPAVNSAVAANTPMQGGYHRIHGELLMLGAKVTASTVWQILKDAGIDPAAERTSTTWSGFLFAPIGASTCGVPRGTSVRRHDRNRSPATRV